MATCLETSAPVEVSQCGDLKGVEGRKWGNVLGWVDGRQGMGMWVDRQGVGGTVWTDSSIGSKALPTDSQGILSAWI